MLSDTTPDGFFWSRVLQEQSCMRRMHKPPHHPTLSILSRSTAIVRKTAVKQFATYGNTTDTRTRYQSNGWFISGFEDFTQTDASIKKIARARAWSTEKSTNRHDIPYIERKKKKCVGRLKKKNNFFMTPKISFHMRTKFFSLVSREIWTHTINWWKRSKPL